jgi:Protein of unknown function (DUF616)
MRKLVYTCVFNRYDRVYPPVIVERDVDYVIVTEDASMKTEGWRLHLVDASGFSSPKAANLYHRALIHRVLPGYDLALYIDGNIRLIGNTSRLWDEFSTADHALRLFHHPLRKSVKEEAKVCISNQKISIPSKVAIELNEYEEAGFMDDQGLVETTIMLRNHRHPDLDAAMELWWQLFQRHQTRDQLSLPYVLWKTGVSRSYHGFNFRDPNPYFGLYPHRGAAHVPPLYSHLSARAYDSPAHKALLQTWHAWWTLRRAARRLLSPSKPGGAA